MTNLRASDLVTMVGELCSLHGLSYDSTPPVQVSPGVFMFHATPLHESCRRSGHCRQHSYYAATYGDNLRLV